jgi:type IV pilus assembly protein PilQ
MIEPGTLEKSVLIETNKMRLGLTNPGGSRRPFILFASFLILWCGCNSNLPSTSDSPLTKLIVGIRLTEENNSWNCKISGNRQLTFWAINNLSPMGLLLYFPDTRLGLSKSNPPVPTNEIIDVVEADEISKKNETDSRILIGLKLARPYNITPAEDEIVISFPKVLTSSVKRKPGGQPPVMGAAGGDRPARPAATLLRGVTAVPMQDYLIINLVADGTIRDYRSFTIDNPARIVFDIHNVKSQFSSARTIPVDSRWVRRIRYNSYPERLRLVLDTERQFLADHFSFATEFGLLIYVGKMPEKTRP